jgi:NAD(P)-dependent dehydrogenase (short-subunit alcohol dehydrogenase family)
VDPDNPHLHGTYGPWKAYGQAKLANRHFAVGLQRQFARAGVDTKSMGAHPGLSNTDLQTRTVREGGGGLGGTFSHRWADATGMAPEQGALSQLRAATDPTAKGGAFYGPLWVTSGPPVAKPLVRPGADRAVEILWIVSERETGLPIDVEAVVRAAR